MKLSETRREELAKLLIGKLGGHNPCPICGSPAYELIADGKRHIFCLECGLSNGLSCQADSEFPGADWRQLQAEWNEQFLRASMTEKVMKTAGISDGDYLVVQCVMDDIMFIAKTQKEVDAFLLSKKDDIYVHVYRVSDGRLIEIG